jgi:hypothetical protein
MDPDRYWYSAKMLCWIRIWIDPQQETIVHQKKQMKTRMRIPYKDPDPVQATARSRAFARHWNIL